MVLRYVRIKHCLIQTSCGGLLLDRKTVASAHWIKLSNEMSYILPNSGLCKLQPGHIFYITACDTAMCEQGVI